MKKKKCLTFSETLYCSINFLNTSYEQPILKKKKKDMFQHKYWIKAANRKDFTVCLLPAKNIACNLKLPPQKNKSFQMAK